MTQPDYTLRDIFLEVVVTAALAAIAVNYSPALQVGTPAVRAGIAAISGVGLLALAVVAIRSPFARRALHILVALAVLSCVTLGIGWLMRRF